MSDRYREYCEECGSEMLPSANQTGFSKYTGEPLYALWLYCRNKECERLIAGVPTSTLVKTGVSKIDAEKWIGKSFDQKNQDNDSALQRIISFFASL